MSQTQELSPSASLERQEEEPKKKTKSRRPPNTAFRQQRLKAWQPILTPKTVLPIFYVVGLLFALFGGLMLWASTEVQELALDYTNCENQSPEGDAAADPGVLQPIGASRVVAHFSDDSANLDIPSQVSWAHQNVSVPIGTGSATYNSVNCTLQFSIPNNIDPPIFLYYRLTNFYQNHRRYVKSLDQDQLAGDALSNDTISNSLCDPLQIDDATGKAYYPCGLIANSIFNDTIGEPINVNPANPPEGTNNITYHMTDNNIAWSSDGALYQKTQYTNDQVVPPPNWIKRYPGGVYSDEFPIPNIHEMENFWVWMRTAGLPTFSKLARKNTTATLPAGTYQIQITSNFPAHDYGGTKQILISTRTVIGGKNPFLGIAYIVVAGICIVLAVIFTAMNLVRPRKLGDHRYLSWNNDQPSTATVATGRN